MFGGGVLWSKKMLMQMMPERPPGGCWGTRQDTNYKEELGRGLGGKQGKSEVTLGFLT